jgi:hypothetical protein
MALLATLAAATALLACPSTDALVAGGEPAFEPGTDAGAATAADASSDALTDTTPASPPNLLPDGDMDNGCADWTPTFATTSKSVDLAGDGGSCRVCYTPGLGRPEAFGITKSFPIEGAQGTTFAVTAMVRRAPNDAGEAAAMSATMQVTFVSRSVIPESDITPVTALGSASTPLSLEHVVQMSAIQAEITFAASSASSSACFNVDDVTVIRAK